VITEALNAGTKALSL